MQYSQDCCDNLLRVKRGISQVVILVIEVDIVNSRHRIDDIERAVESAFVILKHRLVQRALYDGTHIVAVLFENSVEIIYIYCSEEAQGR